VLEANWNTGTSYTTNAGLVSQGLTYTFKIRSANSVGYSLESTTISIKAAQVPDRPDPAPTTLMVNSDIRISWLAPNNRGQTITAYIVKIRTGDGVSFQADASCDGSLSTVVSDLSCKVPISVLRAQPYSLAWGQTVVETVIAVNSYG